MNKLSNINIRQMILIFITVLAILSGCKKSDPTPALPFTYLGTWTVHENFTKGIVASESFFATLHSDGRWAFMENATSIPDIGPWSSFENNITLTWG